ncbi:MAG: hypothetical protein A3I00_02665 [Betaproteobacteria bacterium RIFCSPLOWO2_02_FULL_64_12]|nr:MAG: hypothetical protein A3I00_02665 [Betaproteobacteria bacterium RIFCSPLOWO2_02_FULL_64_12]
MKFQLRNNRDFLAGLLFVFIGALALPPQDVVNESYRQYLPDTRRPLGVLEWPALLRKLDRIDPS